jgi:hypothetical protein
LHVANLQLQLPSPPLRTPNRQRHHETHPPPRNHARPPRPRTALASWQSLLLSFLLSSPKGICGCPCLCGCLFFCCHSAAKRRNLRLPSSFIHTGRHLFTQQTSVISTEATHSLIVSSAVKSPPHYASASGNITAVCSCSRGRSCSRHSLQQTSSRHTSQLSHYG